MIATCLIMPGDQALVCVLAQGNDIFMAALPQESWSKQPELLWDDRGPRTESWPWSKIIELEGVF
jgi:hypothetical protein